MSQDFGAAYRDRINTVLVVDNDSISRHFIRKALSGMFTILEASDGCEALGMIRKANVRLLVLLDLGIPGMDGLELLDMLKKDPQLSLLPVIVTSDSLENEERCLALGAADFVCKPYGRSLLLRVNNIILLYDSETQARLFATAKETGCMLRRSFLCRASLLMSANPSRRFDLVLCSFRNIARICEHIGVEHFRAVFREMAKWFHRRDGVLLVGQFAHDAIVLLVNHMEDPDGFLPPMSSSFGDIGSEYVIPAIYGICADDAAGSGCGRALSPLELSIKAESALSAISDDVTVHVSRYDASLKERLDREEELENSFRRLLHEGMFEVWVQPKCSPDDGRIVGGEALVRLRRKDGSILPPSRFIPLFEHDGLITELDEYMLGRVRTMQKSWLDEGLPVVPVSINLSRKSMTNAPLVERIIGEAGRHGLSPGLVPLEITEESVVGGELVGSLATRLSDAGIPLHMDDFGTGDSSLHNVLEMPFTAIKIDKMFVDRIGTPRGEIVLVHIVALMRELGLSVVAEGAETEAQAAFLRSLHVDAVQGYYYSPPMRPEAFRDALASGMRPGSLQDISPPAVRNH